MSPLTQIIVIFRKEVKDAFRDRRSLCAFEPFQLSLDLGERTL